MGNKLTIMAAAGRAQLPPLDEPRRVEVDARALLVTPSPTEAEPPQLHFKCVPATGGSATEGCTETIFNKGGVSTNRFGFTIDVYLGKTCEASTKYAASQTNKAGDIVKAGINLLKQAGGSFVAAVFSSRNGWGAFGKVPSRVVLSTDRPAADAGGACPAMCSGALPCTSMYTLLENIASFSNNFSETDADFQKALSEALWSAVGEVSQYVAFSGETAPTMPASLLTAPTPAPASA